MTNEETIERLLAVVLAGVDMRTAQALYFKVRSSEYLIAAKNAEKRFDTLACQAISGLRRPQRGDMSSPPAA